MERKVCPYLGRPDDEQTSLAFPSEGNFCHKAAPPAAVTRKHQADYCLGGQHGACPVFLARSAAPLPATLAAPKSQQVRARPALGKTILAGAALLIYLATIWLGGPRIAARMLMFSNPGQGGSPPIESSFADLFGKPASTQPASEPAPLPRAAMPKPAKAAPQVAGACPFPAGWEVYTVQPTDSIFRLSILFGVSQEDLLKANCLGSQANLAPGSTVYVPPVRQPTAQALATQPPLVFQPVVPVLEFSGDEEEENQPAPTEDPTAVPTTPDPTAASEENKKPDNQRDEQRDEKKDDREDDRRDDKKDEDKEEDKDKKDDKDDDKDDDKKDDKKDDDKKDDGKDDGGKGKGKGND